MATSVFQGIQQAAPIEVFALAQACRDDPNQQKVDLTAGTYRTDEGQPWVLPVVRTVEAQLASDNNLNKEYLPVTGIPDYCQAAVRLLLGDGHKLIVNKQADGVQSVGGTGALYLAMAFLHQNLEKKSIYVSNPTWANHKGIAKMLGYPHVKEYRYWDAEHRTVNIQAMCEDLKSAEEGSVVVLHACAHNPTGMDLSHEQWTQIANIVRERKHFPLFDIAYQGFASGDLDGDAWAVRYFAELGFEAMVAQSFSKNFGLYNERVGNLTIISHDAAALGRVKSQIQLIVRQVYSNPPNHGARIVATVLNNPALCAEWKENVKTMADRVKLMRQKLFQKLRGLGTPGTWNHIIEQIGMFSFTGLNRRQVEHLRNRHHVYMMTDGRINMCGLNTRNIDYVGEAIHDAVCNVADDAKM